MSYAFDAQALRADATDPHGVYIIHRGDFDHDDGPECECGPLVLNYEQIHAHTETTLQELLNSHFRLH